MTDRWGRRLRSSDLTSDGIETVDAKLFHLDRPGESRDDLWVDDNSKHQVMKPNTADQPFLHIQILLHAFLRLAHFRLESFSSCLIAPSVTFHLMQTSPATHVVAYQQISICMGNMTWVSGRCLNKPTSRTYTHLKKYFVWYIVYT